MTAPARLTASRARFPRLPGALATAALLLGVITPVPVEAQQQPLIAVLALEAIEASSAEAEGAGALLEAGLVQSGAWSVMGAAERDRRLAARGATVELCTEPACAAEAGRVLEVEHVVLGTLARVGGNLIINAKVVEVRGANVLAADSVSAASREELPGACATLARRLTARALGLAEAQPEPDEGGAAPVEAGEVAAAAGDAARPAAAGEESGPGPAAAGAAAGDDGAGSGEPDAAAGRSLSWANLSGAGGALVGLLGNVCGSVAFQLLRASDEAYEDYLAATVDFDALWSQYRGLHAAYGVTTIASFAFWAAAAASPPLHWGYFEHEAFALTAPGRRAYAWGTGLIVVGHLFDLLAGAQSYRVEFLYEDYQSAGVDRERLHDRYVAGRVVYVSERALSYTLWGLGAAGAGGAFFLRGERQPVVEGFWERTLTVAGTALLSAGGFTRTVALKARQDYANSLGSDDQAWDRWVGYSIASCLLWAAGGTALLLPVGAAIPRAGGDGDSGDEATARRPAQLSLVPAPGGLTLQVVWAGRWKRE